MRSRARRRRRAAPEASGRAGRRPAANRATPRARTSVAHAARRRRLGARNAWASDAATAIDGDLRRRARRRAPSTPAERDRETPSSRVDAPRTATSAATSPSGNAPPSSTTKPNLAGSARSAGRRRSRASSAATTGATSSSAAGSSPASGLRQTLRTASASASASSRPSAASASCSAGSVASRDAAQLQVGARGEVDHAVAEACGRNRRSPRERRSRAAAAGEAQAHEQPVAGRHRPQRAGAPAFDVRRRSCRASAALAADRPTLSCGATSRSRAAAPRRSARRWRARGLRVGVRQEGAHRVVAAGGVEQQVELPARRRRRSVAAKAKRLSTRLGDLGRAAMAVPHLAGEPARVGGAAAQRRARSPRRACAPSARSGSVASSVIERRRGAERRGGGGEAALVLGEGVGVEHVLPGQVLHMDEGVGAGDARRGTPARLARPRRRR